MIDFLKNKYINRLLKGKMMGITSQDMIRIERKGEAYIDNKKLSKETIDRIKEEAEYFKNSFLWKEVFVKSIERAACKKGIEESMDFRDVGIAKAMILCRDVMATILTEILKNL